MYLTYEVSNFVGFLSVFSHLRILDFVFFFPTLAPSWNIQSMFFSLYFDMNNTSFDFHFTNHILLSHAEKSYYVHISVAQTPTMLCGEIKNHY